MTRRLFIFFLLLALAQSAGAAPPNLDGIYYNQHPGGTVPLDATLTDEHGTPVRLATLMHGKPLILALGYFHCPSLCGVVRADLFHALGQTNLVGDKDYSLVNLSIDSRETPSDAATSKAEDLARFPARGAQSGWHFLTASAATVRTIATAVGFRERFDPKLQQFLHPSGIVFITPAGVISSYLLGVGYQPNDLALAVTRATRGTVQAAALPVLLLCYNYDPNTGRYSLAIMKLLRLAGIVTVLTLGVTFFLAFRRSSAA